MNFFLLLLILGSLLTVCSAGYIGVSTLFWTLTGKDHWITRFAGKEPPFTRFVVLFCLVYLGLAFIMISLMIIPK